MSMAALRVTARTESGRIPALGPSEILHSSVPFTGAPSRRT